MKKNIVIALSIIALIISCNNNGDSTGPTSGKPLTENVPSADKTKREGTPLAQFNSKGVYAGVALTESQAKEYNLAERLYSTTWYKSEEEFDDGVLETEKEFVLFNANSWKSTQEYENGKLDDTDFSSLTLVDNMSEEENTLNAVIVQVKEVGEDETEFEGYYLTSDRKMLYIIEGDNQTEVKNDLLQLIKDVKEGQGNKHSDNRYLLSIQAR